MSPADLQARYASIPTALLRHSQWCGCGHIPSSPKHPDIISGIEMDNPKNLHTFEEVCSASAYKGYQGAGIILNGQGLCAIDLDHILTPAGEVMQGGQYESFVADIVEKATECGAYIEVSTSGTGLHIIGVGNASKDIDKGEWLSPEGKRGIEVYAKAHFLYLTGQPWQGLKGKVAEITDVIDLAEEAIKKIQADALAKREGQLTQQGNNAALITQCGLQDNCTISGAGKVTATRNLLDRVKAMALHNADMDEAGLSPKVDINLQNTIKRGKLKDKFISLMQGNLALYGGDNSAADEALLSILMWYAGPVPMPTPDLHQVARIWRKSALYRPSGREASGQKKHNEADYVARSIANALALWLYNRASGKAQYNPEEASKKNKAEHLQAIMAQGGKLLAISADKFERIIEELFDQYKHALTEGGAAERAALALGDDIRYDAYNKKWYAYSEATGCWAAVPVDVLKGAVGSLFKKIESNAKLKKLNGEEIEADEASSDKDDVYTQYVKYARKQCTASALRNIVDLLQTFSELQISPNDFDKDIWLLNTPAGELNLKTGQLGPHQRESYCTRITKASLPAAYSKNSLFKRTLKEIIPSDKTRRYVQMYVGTCLCGDASDAKALWVHGEGGCGKSTLFNAVQEMLGSYAVTIDKEALLTSRNDGGAGKPKPHLLRLQGARLAMCAETDWARKLNTSAMKNITGGDKVEARALYSNNTVEFQPCFTLIMCSNYPPNLYDVHDSGLKRRLRALQFRQSFATDGDFKRSVNLKSQPECLGDILLWAYEGFKMWEAQGCIDSGLESKQYPVPPEVKKDTAQVYNDSDTIQWFLDEYCTVGEGQYANKAQMYSRFSEEAKGMWSGGKKRFFDDMEQHGFEVIYYQGAKTYKGVSIKPREYPRDEYPNYWPNT